MTTSTLQPPSTDTEPTRSPRDLENRRSKRWPLVAMLVCSLVGSSLLRDRGIVQEQRAEGISGETVANNNSLSRLNSYSLALLLGGLRGPLVMMLWSSSESQKAEKNLEDFDTKVEWIRLLQPEFDTVHIFQIWNKAYNVSVQMSSLSNKYMVILDAVEYAKSVDRERPDDVNILTSMGQVYFDKFGNSTEKNYYRNRVRSESLPHVSRQKLRKDDPGYRRIEMDPILDAKGDVLPEYLEPRITPEAGKIYNGAELQFLPQFGPYPYGISPYGLAYNVFKRAQLLLTERGQHHAQMSDGVIDARPALTLKNWAEEEAERGRRLELVAFGKESPSERNFTTMETATAAVPPSATLPKAGDIPQAVFSYAQAAKLADGALAEYDRHLSLHSENAQNYLAHIDTTRALRELALADHDYLAALGASGEAKSKLLNSAAEHYNSAIDAYGLVILHYYTDDGVIKATFPKGISKITIKDIPAPQRRQILMAAHRIQSSRPDLYSEDRSEYDGYIQRCFMRLHEMGK